MSWVPPVSALVFWGFRGAFMASIAIGLVGLATLTAPSLAADDEANTLAK